MELNDCPPEEVRMELRPAGRTRTRNADGDDATHSTSNHLMRRGELASVRAQFGKLPRSFVRFHA